MLVGKWSHLKFSEVACRGNTEQVDSVCLKYIILIGLQSYETWKVPVDPPEHCGVQV